MLLVIKIINNVNYYYIYYQIVSMFSIVYTILTINALLVSVA